MCRKYNSLILTCEKYAASKFEKKKKKVRALETDVLLLFLERWVCVCGGGVANLARGKSLSGWHFLVEWCTWW